MNIETIATLFVFGLAVGGVGNYLALSNRYYSPGEGSIRGSVLLAVAGASFVSSRFGLLAVLFVLVTIAAVWGAICSVNDRQIRLEELSWVLGASGLILFVLLGFWQFGLESPAAVLGLFVLGAGLGGVGLWIGVPGTDRAPDTEEVSSGWAWAAVLLGFYLVALGAVSVGPVTFSVEAGLPLMVGLLAGIVTTDFHGGKSLPETSPDAVRTKLDEIPAWHPRAPDTGAEALQARAKAQLEDGAYDEAYETASRAVRQARAENALGRLAPAVETLDDHNVWTPASHDTLMQAKGELNEGSVDDIQVRTALNDAVAEVADAAVDVCPDTADDSDVLERLREEAKSAQYLSERSESAANAVQIASEKARERESVMRSRAESAIESAEQHLQAVEKELPVEDDTLAETRQYLERAEIACDEADYDRAKELAEQAERAATVERDLVRAEWIRDRLENVLPDGTDLDVECRDAIESAREAVSDDPLASDSVNRALEMAEQHRDASLESQLSLMESIENVAERESVREAATRSQRAASDGDWETALESAQKARNKALSEFPERLSELHRTVLDALESDDFATADERFEEAEAVAEALIDVATVESDEHTAASARDVRAELKTEVNDRKTAVREEAERLAARGNRLHEQAEKQREQGDIVEAARLYADSAETFEAAGEQLAVVETDPAVAYAERADELEAELEAIAALAIERTFDRIPDDDFDALDEAAAVRQKAAVALDRDDWLEAVTKAEQAVETAREGLREFISTRQSAANDAIREDAYEQANEQLQRALEACESVRRIALADEDMGFVEGVETTASDIQESLADVSAEAREYAEELEAAATEDLERADNRFEAGQYGAARDIYESVRDRYAEAESIADTFELTALHEQCARSREQSAERIGYCRLAALSDRLETLQSRVHNAPEEAVKDLEELITEIEDLSFDRTAQQTSREELLVEAIRSKLQAQAEQGRERMTRAEAAYDGGERYTARDRYQDAHDYLEDVASDLEASRVEKLPLLDALLTACETNIEYVSQELAGVAAISTAEDGLKRVGSPGEPIAETKRSTDGVEQETNGPTAASATNSGPDVSAEATVAERHELLGEGGNAKVWRVTLEDGREAALKVPKWSGTLTKTDIERFEREADTWSQLDDHPNIVTVYDWGFDAEPWLLMEYVPDGTLDEQVGELSTTRAIKLAAAIARALVHARGVAHLDIKPENILMDGDTPKLADWGLAKVAFADDGTDTQLGLSPPYAAPEQIDRTRGDRDHQTDIYQLGVTTYELLTGRLPYPPEDPESLEARILAGEPPKPSDIGDVSNDVEQIVLRAMAVDRDRRYEAPIQFRDALEEVLDTV